MKGTLVRLNSPTNAIKIPVVTALVNCIFFEKIQPISPKQTIPERNTRKDSLRFEERNVGQKESTWSGTMRAAKPA